MSSVFSLNFLSVFEIYASIVYVDYEGIFGQMLEIFDCK